MPQDRSNEVPPIPSNTPPIAKVPPKNRQADANQEAYWHRRNERMQCALIVVGVMVMFIYAGQLYEMRQAVALQTKTLRIDQRAWVAPDGIVGTTETNQPYIVTVLLKNTGKTFAKGCFIRSGTQQNELSEDYPNFDPIIEAAQHIELGTVAPNQVVKHPLQISQTKQEFDEVAIPTVRFFIFGEVTYDDIFGCHHWTKFCFRARPAGKFEVYGPYNDTDDNCPP
jgi:hypothetical protein